MAIQYLNGFRLQQAIIAGSENVIRSQQALNDINVFPVPDGDTGTNMASTLKSVSQGAMQNVKPNLATLSAQVADSAINGARGNSGAILAQFFQGLSEAFDKQARIDLEQFSSAVSDAVRATRGSIANPIDGTIITVMDDWANWIRQNWQHAGSFESLLQQSLEVAKQSLQRTPSKLKVLAQAKVVDAGAQGFVNFLEGVVECIQLGKVYKLSDIAATPTRNDALSARPSISNLEASDHHEIINPQSLSSGELDFQYCTECIVQGDDINIAELRHSLLDWGNSTVVVGGKSKAKIHIHTNDPNRLFDHVGHFGEIVGIKADDMWAQYRQCIGWKNSHKVALITDSSAAIPQSLLVKYNIDVIPLQLLSGDQTYLDRVNIQSDSFYHMMQEEKRHFSTSLPMIVDYETAIVKARQQAQSAIAIFISSKLSGTYQTALKVAQKFKDFPIRIIDSKNVAGGQGLIVSAAAEAIHNGMDLDTVAREVRLAIEQTRMIIAPRNMETLVRGGRVSKHTGFIASLLKLIPVIETLPDGSLEKRSLALGVGHARRKMLKRVKECVKSHHKVSLSVIHANALEEAQALAHKLSQISGQSNIEVLPATPVIVAHCGPGTIGIAIRAS